MKDGRKRDTDRSGRKMMSLQMKTESAEDLIIQVFPTFVKFHIKDK